MNTHIDEYAKEHLNLGDGSVFPSALNRFIYYLSRCVLIGRLADECEDILADEECEDGIWAI
jgi:hypothetical protein